MAEAENLFADNAAYDRAVGRWSRVVGEKFLDWLALPNGLRWLDVGCGTGSFTETILTNNAPSSVSGIDPLEGQIAFARQRPNAGRIDYRQADAISMPYADDTFDVATMALVVQYLPEPTKAMAEISRVVGQSGTVAAYTWISSPVRPVMEAFKTFGVEDRRPPNDYLRSPEAIGRLFAEAGFEELAHRTIEIELGFDTFDDFWDSQTTMAFTRSSRKFTEPEADQLKSNLRKRFDTIPNGQVCFTAQASAVRGIVRK